MYDQLPTQKPIHKGEVTPILLTDLQSKAIIQKVTVRDQDQRFLNKGAPTLEAHLLKVTVHLHVLILLRAIVLHPEAIVAHHEVPVALQEAIVHLPEVVEVAQAEAGRLLQVQGVVEEEDSSPVSARDFNSGYSRSYD